MNNSLLSSKKLDWCTPLDFFKELDKEFRFNLDPAATEKSAKCAKYFTLADDGLKMDWGGIGCSAIPLTAAVSTNGFGKGTRRAGNQGHLLLCSYQPEPTRRIFTNTFFTAKLMKYVF